MCTGINRQETRNARTVDYGGVQESNTCLPMTDNQARD